MSLDELLRDDPASPAWSRQRRKLIRIGFGLLVVAAALATGLFLVLSFRQPRPAPAAATETPTESQSLANLMQVHRDTEEFRRSLAQDSARPPAGPRGGPVYRGSAAGAAAHTGNYDPGEGFQTLSTATQEVYVPTGAVFQAQLLTPIKTSVERTFVMAETTNEYRMDMKRRIVAGSRLIGRSHFDPILKGVIVEFDTIVNPAGIESQISGLALSRNALPEIEGLYFSDRMINYGTALAFGFLSGFADAGRERDYTILGSQARPSISNQVLAGLSTASFQVANEILSDIRNNAIEYVVVPAGERVFVVLTRRYNIIEPRRTTVPGQTGAVR